MQLGPGWSAMSPLNRGTEPDALSVFTELTSLPREALCWILCACWGIAAAVWDHGVL